MHYPTADEVEKLAVHCLSERIKAACGEPSDDWPLLRDYDALADLFEVTSEKYVPRLGIEIFEESYRTHANEKIQKMIDEG